MSRLESHVANTFGGVAGDGTQFQRPHCTHVQGRNKFCICLTCFRIPLGSWPTPGQSDGSTAMGSREPGSSEEGRNARRRLDIDKGPDDENARGAVLLRFLCEQCLPDMHAWLQETLPPTDQPERVHCRRGTRSARIVFDTSAKCPDFVARLKDDGLTYSANSPSCTTTSTILVRQSRSPQLREIGRHSAPLWKALATKLQDIFLEHDDTERHEQLFSVISLGVTCLTTFCNKLLVKQVLRPRIARPICDDRLFASSPCRRLASRGHFSYVTPSYCCHFR